MSLKSIQSLQNSVEPQNAGIPSEQEAKSQYYLLNEPIKDSVNFKGDNYRTSKNNDDNGFIKFLVSVLGIAAVGIGGLGILGKNISKINTEKWFGKLVNKDFVKKSADTCYGWCKQVKAWGNSAIKWGKDLFKGSSKK